jgi:poly(A) polymerase
VYGYLVATQSVEADVTILSVADRLATRGRKSDEAIVKHLALAREIMGEALRWRAERPDPLVRGDELVAELGVSAGPEVGRLLGELAEAQFVGEVSTREEALDRARRLLMRP